MVDEQGKICERSKATFKNRNDKQAEKRKKRERNTFLNSDYKWSKCNHD